VSKAIRGIAVGGGVRHVIHLHGYCEYPAAIILARDDYTQAYGIPRVAVPPTGGHPGAALPPLPEVVRPQVPTNLFLLTAGLLATRRVVFVGFSLDDPYFTEVLTHVCDALWEWGSGVHFAVLPFDPEREQAMRDRAQALKETMGIETLLYQAIGGDHSELGKLLAEIRAEVAVDRPPATGPGLGVVVEGSAATAPEWVQQHNAAQLKRIRDREG
jgi:hypothetical protein